MVLITLFYGAYYVILWCLLRFLHGKQVKVFVSLIRPLREQPQIPCNNNVIWSMISHNELGNNTCHKSISLSQSYIPYTMVIWYMVMGVSHLPTPYHIYYGHMIHGHGGQSPTHPLSYILWSSDTWSWGSATYPPPIIYTMAIWYMVMGVSHLPTPYHIYYGHLIHGHGGQPPTHPLSYILWPYDTWSWGSATYPPPIIYTMAIWYMVMGVSHLPTPYHIYYGHMIHGYGGQPPTHPLSYILWPYDTWSWGSATYPPPIIYTMAIWYMVMGVSHLPTPYHIYYGHMIHGYGGQPPFVYRSYQQHFVMVLSRVTNHTHGSSFIKIGNVYVYAWPDPIALTWCLITDPGPCQYAHITFQRYNITLYPDFKWDDTSPSSKSHTPHHMGHAPLLHHCNHAHTSHGAHTIVTSL